MKDLISIFNMKFIAVILLFMESFSFAQNQDFRWDIISISPKDNSILHHPRTNILIKNSVKLNIIELKKRHIFELYGSKSGYHKIDLSISNNQTALVLNHIIAFEYNERVQ